MIDQLAPCHFCGGKITHLAIKGINSPNIVLDCENCGEILLFSHFRTQQEAIDGAVDLWNSYTTPPEDQV